MSHENLETVRLAYDAFARRSLEGIRDRLADDFRFHNRAEFPGRAVYRADDTPIWADLDETFTDYEMFPEDFEDEGDHVLVTIRQSTRVSGSEARVSATLYHLWHLRDGVLREGWAFTDRDDAVRRRSSGSRGGD